MLNFTQCVLDNNEASSGGGIVVRETSELIVTDCTLTDNAGFTVNTLLKKYCFETLPILQPCKPLINGCMLEKSKRGCVIVFETLHVTSDTQFSRVEAFTLKIIQSYFRIVLHFH